MKFILNIIVLLLFSSILHAEELPRRGSLGVKLTPEGQDQLKCIIADIIKGGTAESIGMKKNDILVSVNGSDVDSFQDALLKISKTVGGESSEFKVKRGNQIVTLEGKVKPMPFNVPNNYELSSFNYKNNKIRTILETPQGNGPFPVIYYIQGYPCSSCEYTNPGMPIRKFIDDMIKNGYAVYRVEKPNQGDSRGPLNCEDIDFPTENEVFSKGYEELVKLREIDPENIVIFGHSLGGMHAPIISSKYNPKATVVYGIVTKDWYDYMLETFVVQNPLFDSGYIEAEQTKNKAREYLYPIYFKSKSPLQLINSEEDSDFMKNFLNYSEPDLFFGRNYKFFVSLNAVNIPEEWSKVKNTVLSLHGQYDLQALNNQGAKNVVQIINYYNPETRADYIEVPNTEHIFIKVNSQREVAEKMTSGTFWKYASDNYNPEVAKILTDWLKEII